ncbi:MAG: tyrosine-type recombinase/integrase [Oscillospiraceae bacterium]|nr:tyrosine-type recombinase/integrase [Oscillospiraceae bacterium]
MLSASLSASLRIFSILLYNGTDLKTVQERLGHADFTTTNKYLHLVEQADVEAVDSLENLLLKCA